VAGAHIRLGAFSDEDDAGRAYDAYVIDNDLGRELNFLSSKAAPHRPARGTSRYRGVCWSKSKRKWSAEITVGGTHVRLGRFDDEDEAAHAYDAYVRAKHLGRKLNCAPLAAVRASGAARPARSSARRDEAGFLPSPMNAGKIASRHRGATWNKKDRRWRSGITVDGRQQHLGSFRSEDEAARAFDAFIVAHALERVLNFPRCAVHFFCLLIFFGCSYSPTMT